LFILGTSKVRHPSPATPKAARRGSGSDSASTTRQPRGGHSMAYCQTLWGSTGNTGNGAMRSRQPQSEGSSVRAEHE
jgi:hypothetical protein